MNYEITSYKLLISQELRTYDTCCFCQLMGHMPNRVGSTAHSAALFSERHSDCCGPLSVLTTKQVKSIYFDMKHDAANGISFMGTVTHLRHYDAAAPTSTNSFNT